MPSYAPVIFTGNGTVGPYVIPWPYISPAHVHVFVDDLEVGFTWVGTATIALQVAAQVGAEGCIERITPIDAPLVDRLGGADLTESNLDLATRQALFIVQESDLVQAEQAAETATAAAAAALAAQVAAEAAAEIAIGAPAVAPILPMYRALIGGL
jgi:hypothetical protein